MDKKLIEQVISEAREEEANLIVTDRRDTFTVEKDDVSGIEVTDGYLKVSMQEGKATVYVTLDEIYKLVVEKEKLKKTSARTGFGASRD